MDITAEGWGWRHAGRSEWAARELSFSIPGGQRVLLLGASGAGKTTLLHAMAGVLGGPEDGAEQGRLLVGGQHPSRRHGQVGLVMQDPTSQVVLEHVGDDVAFGCENLAVPRQETWQRVRRALDAVGLDVALDRETHHLSGGQKQRLALAGVLAMQADVLLLDEPTANLDPAGVVEVRDAVARVVQDRSTTLVVVEHRVEVWAPLVDRVLVLAPGGGVLADGSPDEVFTTHRDALLAAGVWVPGVPVPPGLALPGAPSSPGTVAGTSSQPHPGHHGHHPAETLLHTEGLSIGWSAADPVLTGVEVSVPAGTSTVVTGPNGAGKSTLALTLAGLLDELAGRVVADASLRPAPGARRPWRRNRDLADPAAWTSRELVTRIGTVFQNPEHQFVATSVREELAVGLRALARVDPSWTAERIGARVEELLTGLHLAHLADANPFTLSGGEQRRLSVGTVLATGPRVIVLDEPTFGQDRNTWLDLVRLVGAMVADGCAVVGVTHDADYIQVLGQHQIHLAASHG